jgi:hypothetical protein
MKKPTPPSPEGDRIAWIRDNLDNALASGQRRRYLAEMLAHHQSGETNEKGLAWPTPEWI